jgi:hypothetical protein
VACHSELEYTLYDIPASSLASVHLHCPPPDSDTKHEQTRPAPDLKTEVHTLACPFPSEST